MLDLYKLYNEMHDNDVMLSYKGEVTASLVNSFLGVFESRLEAFEEDKKVKKKVFNVLVETLQNLQLHVDELPSSGGNSNEEKKAVFMLWTEGDDYKLSTGHHILVDNVSKLKTWLDKINKVAGSREELRSLYKQVLDNGIFSSKGGGGLGFIDIAKKSGQQLEYDFRPVNKEYAFFVFETSIPRNIVK
ncbi:MAG: SiaB family protein kinase [Cyclobacteriaceae bacterium]